MGKDKSRSKATRCTCITKIEKRADSKNCHHPTGVKAQAISRAKPKSIVIKLEKQINTKSRNRPTGVRSHAKRHKRSRLGIEVTIKGPYHPTRVEVHAGNSLKGRDRARSSYKVELNSKASTLTLRV